MHINIDDIDKTDMSFIQEVLSIICEYGKIHPTKFVSVRSELIWWQLSHSSKNTIRCSKEYYNLINGFSNGLVPILHLPSIEKQKKNIHGLMLLFFDENVRDKHKTLLLNAIEKVPIIKGSYISLFK